MTKTVSLTLSLHEAELRKELFLFFTHKNAFKNRTCGSDANYTCSDSCAQKVPGRHGWSDDDASKETTDALLTGGDQPAQNISI